MRIKKEHKMMKTQAAGSYKQFSAIEKVKLGILYPFLSAGQINGKIKQKWQTLRIEEKKVIKTPVQFKPTKGRKRSWTSSSRKQFIKNDKNNATDTPEFINTQKLHDFRKGHEEIYENDFLTGGGTLSSRSSKEMVTPSESKLGQQCCTEPTVDGWTFDDNSDDVTCSDDEGILIKRNFDADGNIVDIDNKLEPKEMNNTTLYNNLAAAKKMDVHRHKERTKRKDNKAEQCVSESYKTVTSVLEETTDNLTEGEREASSHSINVKIADAGNISELKSHNKTSKTKSTWKKRQTQINAQEKTEIKLHKRRDWLNSPVEQNIVNRSVSPDDSTTHGPGEVKTLSTDEELHQVKYVKKKTSKKQNQSQDSIIDEGGNPVCRNICRATRSLSAQEANHNNTEDEKKLGTDRAHEDHVSKTEEKKSLRKKIKHSMEKDENNNDLIPFKSFEAVSEAKQHRSRSKHRKSEAVSETENSFVKDEMVNSNEIHNVGYTMKPSGDAPPMSERLKRTSGQQSARDDHVKRQKVPEDVKQRTDRKRLQLNERPYTWDETDPKLLVAKSAETCVNKSRGTNSTLERILRDLRSTGKLSTSSSEPDLSSQTSQLTDVSDTNEVAINEVDIHDMFSDVTSPEKGSKGLYKTSRMVTKATNSDAQTMSEQFEQLFSEDNDFIFLS